MITKFINSTDEITRETLEGYVMAYPEKVKLGGENIIIRAKAKDTGKVAIVTLGGSGHEPALSGFVGEGMLDLCRPWCPKAFSGSSAF
jgi:dihydroxyacetone kinase-like protein